MRLLQLHERGTLKKSNSCSTIYVDESTVCQPNLKSTIKCVTLAIYYHIKNRQSERQMDIFDEKLHPLTKDGVGSDYSRHNPDHRQVPALFSFPFFFLSSNPMSSWCLWSGLTSFE